MSRFVIMVDFRLRPGARAAFRALIDVNARESVARETGCLRFDVLEPDDNPDCILLYEIYADRAAFQTHLAAGHYKTFAEASEPLCIGRTITPCTLVCEGGA